MEELVGVETVGTPEYAISFRGTDEDCATDGGWDGRASDADKMGEAAQQRFAVDAVVGEGDGGLPW